jgi:hypothetical protein
MRRFVVAHFFTFPPFHFSTFSRFRRDSLTWDLTKEFFSLIILLKLTFNFFPFMQSNTATKFLPVTGEEKKIDVSIENGEAVLRLSTWTEGLGWNCQKTLRVEAGMLDDLHRSLMAARYRLTAQKAENGEENVKNNIIEFPLTA